MVKSVAEQWCDMLIGRGFNRLYSMAGEINNPLMEALHRDRRFERRIELRQESAVVAAAAAAARLTGKPQVCYAGSIPGFSSMLSVWAEAESMKDKLLVLGVLPVGIQIPDHLTDAERVFHVECIEEAVVILSTAIHWVESGKAPVSVILREEIAGLSTVRETLTECFVHAPLPLRPQPKAVTELVSLLSRSKKTLFLCGSGCEGSEDSIFTLARRIQAPIAHTLLAKDVVESVDDLNIGMVGEMGWGAASYAVEDCELLVLWGREFPSSEYFPKHGRVVQITDTEGTERMHGVVSLGVIGNAGLVAQELIRLLPRQNNDDFVVAMRSLHRREQSRLEYHVRNTDETQELRPEFVTRLLSDRAEPDAVFCVESGLLQMWGARYLHPKGQQKIIGSFLLGLREMAIPMAMGAKAAYQSRQVIALCTVGGVLRYMGELLSLQRDFLAVKVLVYSQKKMDEEVLESTETEGEEYGLPRHALASVAENLGLKCETVSTVTQLHESFRNWLAATGPALLEAEVNPLTRPLPPTAPVCGNNGHLVPPGYGRLRRYGR